MSAPAGSFWTTVGAFVLIGPPVGGTVVAVWSAFEQTSPMSLGDWLQLPLGGALIGYLGGAIPAFITGVLASAAAPVVPRREIWVAGATLLGGGVSFVTYSTIGMPPAIFAAGAAASLVASLVGLQVRPRRAN